MLLKKHEIYDICNELNLDYNSIKYVGSGNNGDAYRINDKILKITTDNKEVNTALTILNKNINGVVNYYKVFKFKEYNVILMDYVTPLEKYINIKNPNYLNFVDDLMNEISINWGKINNFNEYINLVNDLFDYSKKDIFYTIVVKLYQLYNKLKQLKHNPDFHIYNIGINKNNELVLFDFNKWWIHK